MGGSTPSSDPNIGVAALKSAQVGEDMLGWMKSQAEVTNGWATEDRARYKDVYEPLQDQYIQEAQDFASPERKQAAATAAVADVGLQGRLATESNTRNAMSMGINPASGRFASASAKGATDIALAKAGAANLSNRNIEDQGRSLKASAINMGNGLAVNPGTSMGLSNGAVATGGQAAMSGYGQQGSLLNTQYQNQMQSYNASNSGWGALGSAAGSIIGMFASSKDIKENKVPVDALGAIEQMPVEQWNYKPGEGDGGQHIGPYAEDFQAATGIGDGKSIDALSMIGLTMGAVRELANEVKDIKSTILQFAPMGVSPDEDEASEDKATDPAEDAAEGEMDDPMEPMGVVPTQRRKAKPAMRMAA